MAQQLKTSCKCEYLSHGVVGCALLSILFGQLPVTCDAVCAHRGIFLSETIGQHGGHQSHQQPDVDVGPYQRLLVGTEAMEFAIR